MKRRSPERAIPTQSDDVPRGTSLDYAKRAAKYAAITLLSHQVETLQSYATWLREEAVPAGGLGPREGGRIWHRHIADSLTFAAGWTHPPPELLDIGTGVGLPGLPLAIAWPDTVVTLLDKGGRRVRLLHRAVRILNLPNVVIAQGDAFAVADEWAGLTFRGSIPAPEAIGLTNRVLAPGSTAVLGLSRRAEEPERSRDLVSLAAAVGLAAEVRQVPEEVLDGTSWLLIMRT